MAAGRKQKETFSHRTRKSSGRTPRLQCQVLMGSDLSACENVEPPQHRSQRQQEGSHHRIRARPSVECAKIAWADGRGTLTLGSAGIASMPSRTVSIRSLVEGGCVCVCWGAGGEGGGGTVNISLGACSVTVGRGQLVGQQLVELIHAQASVHARFQQPCGHRPAVDDLRAEIG